jgi:hypothetical protein
MRPNGFSADQRKAHRAAGCTRPTAATKGQCGDRTIDNKSREERARVLAQRGKALQQKQQQRQNANGNYWSDRFHVGFAQVDQVIARRNLTIDRGSWHGWNGYSNGDKSVLIGSRLLPNRLMHVSPWLTRRECCLSVCLALAWPFSIPNRYESSALFSRCS